MASPAGPNINDYIEMIRRRKWLVAAVITISLCISVVLCFTLPQRFRSTTTVLVESQKIPESYVKSTVEGPLESRLSSIQQIVMSRTLLSQVAKEFALFKGAMSPHEQEDVLNSMRKGIKISMAKTGHARGSDTIDAFVISYAHSDPVKARDVTARFASLFIEENLKFREQFVVGASEFLEQELRMAKEKLEFQENEISAFKSKYMGELPQQMEVNLRTLDRIQGEANAARVNLDTARNRLALLEQQISESANDGHSQIPTEATSNNQRRGVDPLITRLAELERTLATLSAEYRETYPDILLTRNEIETVKNQLAVKYGVDKEDVTPGSTKLLDPAARELLRQRNEAKNDVEVLKERLRRTLEQVKLLEARIERTPAREQDLMILLRDYDNTQRNYQSLLDKKLNARVAENLEKRQKGEQFRILDPADLPLSPEFPNRPLILVGGLIVGCGLGFSAAFGLEMMTPSFRRPDEAETMLGLPVLASIPSFSSVFPGSQAVRQAAFGKREHRKLLSGSQTTGTAGELIERENGLQGTSWNLITKWTPRSMVAEQFRVAATRLTLMTSEQNSTVVLVTSALVGEGKTSTAVNLSYILAQELDRRTLLIDCDLKRPMVHAYSNMPQTPGLVDYLQGDQPLDACIHKMDDVPLWILPTGRSTKGMLELSKIKQLSRIIHDLRPRFDYILIDAPPILPLADLNVLSSMGDLMILVIRAGRTGREVVGQAYKSLRSGCPAGIVLTGVDSISTPYYMYDYGHLDSGTAKRA